MKVSLNTQLAGIGLMILVNCEHETIMDRITSASASHAMTQVGYIAICTPITLQRKVDYYCYVSICMSVRKKLTSFFPSEG